MNNQISILIPTSPIPSHPSTAILDETISNLRSYTDARIIIMMDGVHQSISHRTEDYENYKKSVIEKIENSEYGECFYHDFEWHTHQAKMTETILANSKYVSTPLLLFCEHDCSPIGEIPFKLLCNVLEQSRGINYIRFNIFHEILEEHQYLMLDKQPKHYNGVKLVKTIQWSQRPHIAKVKWYRDLLFTYFKDEKMMIEDRMHSVVVCKFKSLGFDTFGLAIYTPEGNQLRSYHSDGRGDDEKIIEA